MTSIISHDDILALEHGYWQALKDGDADAALALTYDPCVVAGPQGAATYDHKQMSAMSRGKDWRITDFDMGEAFVQTVSDNVAVLGYTINLDMEIKGKPHAMRCAETSAWVKEHGAWRCVLHSETPLGDPFGRASA